MRGITKSLAAAALLIGLQAGAAQAATIAFSSDTAFNAWAAENNWTKLFGGNVRWGNGAANGDWEYAVVNGADSPTNERQYDWQSGNNPHTTTFSFNAVTDIATLALTLPQTSPASSGTFQDAGPNTLFLRAAANDGQTAALMTNIVVEFTNGTFIDLGNLVGDSNGEWIGIYDTRFAGGFSVTSGNATIDGGIDGRGSRPMYQYKVGTSTPVPEPASIALLGTALLGVGALARRRNRA